MSESIKANEEDESVKVKVEESESIKANEDHHILKVKVEETEVKNPFVALKPEVKHEQLKGQSTLQLFFGGSFAAKRVKEEDLFEPVKTRKRGRPSNAEVALAEARARGEALVVTTSENSIKVSEQSIVAQPKVCPGRPPMMQVLKGLEVLQSSNRKLPGAACKRNEEFAATKLRCVK
jgi:hypothetical protein